MLLPRAHTGLIKWFWYIFIFAGLTCVQVSKMNQRTFALTQDASSVPFDCDWFAEAHASSFRAMSYAKRLKIFLQTYDYT